MKKTSVLFAVTVILALFSGCEKESLSLEQVGGDYFNYPSPITCVVDADSTLLVGTSDGHVASYNPENGLFNDIYSSSFSTIYQILPYGQNRILVSFRDGGVRIVNIESGTEERRIKIPHKGQLYSAYKIIPSHKGEILLATSNGLFRWCMDLDTAEEIIANSGVVMQFYGVQQLRDSIVAAGNMGLYFRSDRETNFQHPINSSITSLHNEYILTREGKLIKGYFSRDTIHSFQNDIPIDFVIDSTNNQIFCISHKSVSVVDLAGNHKGRIILPEQHLNRKRNDSCRSIAVIRGDYIYVAPGGARLYKIPLRWSMSEEVISLSGYPDGSIYALSASNDLFRIKGTKSHYVRSFDGGENIKLLGVINNRLILSQNDNIIACKGKSRYFDKPLLKGGKDVKFYYLTGETLFLCNTELIERFQYDGSVFQRTCNYPHKQGDGLQVLESLPDYYPLCLTTISSGLSGEEGMVVGTLHSGICWRSLSDSGAFLRLVDANEYSAVKDIQSADDSTVLVLTDKFFYRFIFSADSIHSSAYCLKDTKSKFITRIIAQRDSVFAYSDYQDFSKGLYLVSLNDNDSTASLQAIRYNSFVINSGRVIDEQIILGGGMGVVGHQDTIISVLKSPPFIFWWVKNYAKFYPFNFILFLFVLTAFVLASTYSLFRRYFREKRRLKLEKEKEKRFIELKSGLDEWKKQFNNSVYIQRLIDELIIISRNDPLQFQNNIQCFMQDKRQLQKIVAIEMLIDNALLLYKKSIENTEDIFKARKKIDNELNERKKQFDDSFHFQSLLDDILDIKKYNTLQLQDRLKSFKQENIGRLQKSVEFEKIIDNALACFKEVTEREKDIEVDREKYYNEFGKLVEAFADEEKKHRWPITQRSQEIAFLLIPLEISNAFVIWFMNTPKSKNSSTYKTQKSNWKKQFGKNEISKYEYSLFNLISRASLTHYELKTE